MKNFRAVSSGLLLIVCVVALSSCGSTSGGRKTVAYPNAITKEIRSAFAAAEVQYLDGKFSEADALLSSFIADQPYTELTDKARFMRGEISFSRKKYESAISRYREAYSQIESPNVGPRARFKEAMSLHKLMRCSEAVAALSKIDRTGLSPLLRLRIDSLGVMASKTAGLQANDYVIWNLRILDDYTAKPALADEAKSLPAGEWLSQQSALESVRKWVADPSVQVESIKALPMGEFRGKPSGSYAEYKLAYELHKTGEPGASKAIKSYVRSYPKSEYHAQAIALMSELGGEVGDAGGVSVGVILPLTGKFALYGKSVLHGIECAAGVYEPCDGPSGIKLVVKDSSYGTMPQIVGELATAGVIAIIGPLLSKDAISAGAEAQKLGIPIISVSQQDGFAEIGDFTFRNFITEKEEIDALVKFSAGKIKLKKYFVLYPSNKKGEEYRQIFEDAVKNMGGRVVESQKYTPNQVEFGNGLRGRGDSEQIQGVLGSGGYDAVFIPDSYKFVSYILPTLEMMGIEKTQYLGTSRWDDQALVDKAGDSAEGAIFVDAFFRGSRDPIVSEFVRKFKAAYNADASLLEALGFDSMKVIANAVIASGAKSRLLMRDVIARTENFSGAAGNFGFDSVGNSTHKIKVLMVKGGRIIEAE